MMDYRDIYECGVCDSLEHCFSTFYKMTDAWETPLEILIHLVWGGA